VIYFDSSALVKLVKAEPESSALAAWIDERAADRPVSSTLAKVEVLLAVRRGGDRYAERARAVIDGVDLISISDEVIDSAAVLDGPGLRSLDAIHLATALHIRGALTGMVVYDRRLFDGAARFGLDPVSPGA
jgi:hypothetical protein